VFLTIEDKEALLKTGATVKDDRTDFEVSKSFAVPVNIEFTRKYRNPTESGVYDVLAKDGSMVKCFVSIGPQGANRNYPFATLVRLEDPRNWINIHQSFIWVGKEYKGWSQWWSDLPAADDLPVSRGKARYMIIGPDGVATLPFCVDKSLGVDASGGPVYDVSFDTYAERDRAGTATQTGLNSYDYDDDYRSWRDGQRIHLQQPTGTKLRSNRGDVYVPEGHKLLRIMPEENDNPKRDGDGPQYETYINEGQSENPPILLGDALDLQAGIFSKTAELRISFDGHAHVIGNTQMTKLAALRHLIVDHGLREQEARDMLGQAEKARGQLKTAAVFRIKYAAPYDHPPYLTGGGPYAPAVIDPMQGYDDVFGSAVPAQHPFEQSINVPDLRADPRNRDAFDPISPDPMASQIASDAADRGQKDVFDDAMVANLLKITNDDRMIDEQIEPLMAGLTSIGTLLMSFYWHTEQFADRFGDDEMDELEDSLRNTFSALGDLTLFLKQRSVEASPDEAASGVDLSDVADQ
jgi:hypothetical protein